MSIGLVFGGLATPCFLYQHSDTVNNKVENFKIFRELTDLIWVIRASALKSSSILVTYVPLFSMMELKAALTDITQVQQSGFIFYLILQMKG